jgi:hypothetical protein
VLFKKHEFLYLLIFGNFLSTWDIIIWIILLSKCPFFGYS